MLLTVKGVLQKDHDTKTTNFYPLPYHRFLAILFSELCADRATFDKFSYQILQDYCNVYHALQPNIVPGFAYSWLELISSRSFLPKLLANPNPDTKGTSPPGNPDTNLPSAPPHPLVPSTSPVPSTFPVPVRYNICTRSNKIVHVWAYLENLKPHLRVGVVPAAAH